MNQVSAERTMSIREVADVFGVGPEAIKKHVRTMYPELLKNGVQTYLNEEQVTAIKKRMLPTTQVVGAVTDREMAEKAAEVMQWLSLKVQDLSGQLEEARPKIEFFDQVTNSKDAIDIGSAAKVLNVKGIGRNKLFQTLRDAGVLQRNNQPYQEYIDRGYFRTIEQSFQKPDGSTHINIKTVVYQKGLNYIRKIVEGDRQ